MTDLNNQNIPNQLEINVDRLNDSMNLINQQLMHLDEYEEDKEEKSVELSDTSTKIGRLKIVNMDEETLSNETKIEANSTQEIKNDQNFILNEANNVITPLSESLDSEDSSKSIEQQQSAIPNQEQIDTSNSNSE